MKRAGTKRKFGYEAGPSSAKAGEAALDWAVACGATDRITRDVQTEVRRIRRRRLVAAAGGVAALVMAAGFLSSWRWTPGKHEPWPTVANAPSAAVLTPLRRILPDGSVVELKNGAGISLHFNPAERRITLGHGEAHFQVARNAGRPFIVTASGIETRAVGTAFTVQLAPTTVEVLVTEGEVETRAVATNPPEESGAAPAPPPPTRVLVAAGNRVVIELAGAVPIMAPVEALTRSEIARKLSWRIPRLEFAGTPLHEVARLFHQHSGARIALGDPALGGLQISGTLRADNIDSLLRLLELEFGIKAERRGEAEFVLHRR